MLPSDYPEVAQYKNLAELLKNQVDMQFDDLRTLLRLPIAEHGLTAGCNLAVAMILFNLIAGASVCLFEASLKGLSDRKDRTRRFKEVLVHFYPWQGESLSVLNCVNCIYDSARNPLAHSFGLDDPNQNRFEVILQKEPLSTDQILELEDATIRPTRTPPTIASRRQTSFGTTRVTLSVPTIFWGVHRMFRALISDPLQADAANTLVGNFRNHWVTLVSDLGSGVES